jgi:hypothetical protein
MNWQSLPSSTALKWLFPNQVSTAMGKRLPENCSQTHLGCFYPKCFCNTEKNQFKEKVDLVARELERTSIALSQFKIDLKDVEVANSILLAGLERLIEKYRYEGTNTQNLSLKLLYCNVISDLETIIKVSEESPADIIAKTQFEKPL